MTERETPGQRIRNLREAAFITQKDFAERIGVAPSQLSRIESTDKPEQVNRLIEEFVADIL